MSDAAMAAAPVLCIGGAHIDRTARPIGAFTLGHSTPVTMHAAPGGVARNVATSLAAAGRAVTLISVLGRDAEGDALRGALAASRIDTHGLLCECGRATASYTAVLDEDGELVVGLADMAIYDGLTPERVAPLLASPIPPGAIVIDSNPPAATIDAVSRHATGATPVFAVAVSPAKVPRFRASLARLSALFLNRAEAEALSGREAETEAGLRDAAAALEDAGVGRIFITLGAGGAIARADGAVVRRDSTARWIRDVTGAGDGFAAGAIDALLDGRDTAEALEAGLAASARIVAEDGAGGALRGGAE